MSDDSSHDEIKMMTGTDQGDQGHTVCDNLTGPDHEDEGSVCGDVTGPDQGDEGSVCESDDQIILIMGTYNPPTRAHIAMSSILRERFPDAQIIYVPSGDAYLKSWKHFDDESIPDLHLRAQLLRGAIDIEIGRYRDPAYSNDDRGDRGGSGIGLKPDDESSKGTSDHREASQSVRNKISVSEIEGDTSKTDGRTYNTASYFKQTTGKKVAIAIGSDQLDKFGQWYKVDELIRDFRIIIFCRGISVDECRRIVGEMFGPSDSDHGHGQGKAVSNGAIQSGAIRNSPEAVEGHFVYMPFEYEGVSSTKIREAVMAGDLESVKDDIPKNVYEYLLKETASF